MWPRWANRTDSTDSIPKYKRWLLWGGICGIYDWERKITARKVDAHWGALRLNYSGFPDEEIG